METSSVSAPDPMLLRWDLLEAQPPVGERLTVRLAMPSKSSDIFIGLDALLRRYVLVEIPEGEPCNLSERTSRGIAVQTIEGDFDGRGKPRVFVEIACLESSGYAALDLVTSELVEALSVGASIGRVRLVQSVLAKWRRFWSGVPQRLLPKEELFGLFGEVWFLLHWLIPSVGQAPAIAMWRGPAGARNDFEAAGLAVEIKTSGRLDGTHQISGLDQLIEPANGFLLLFSLLVREEASADASLPRLVTDIRKILATDQVQLSLFESMLLAAGYEDAHAPEYEKIRLRIRGEGLYRVSQGFPRLIPDSILNGVPSGVGKVTYEIRLDSAGAWLLSDSPKAVRKLFGELTAKRE
jgi:hypothetical protein